MQNDVSILILFTALILQIVMKSNSYFWYYLWFASFQQQPFNSSHYTVTATCASNGIENHTGRGISLTLRATNGDKGLQADKQEGSNTPELIAPYQPA